MLLLGFIRPSTSLKIFESDVQNWAQVAAKETLNDDLTPFCLQTIEARRAARYEVSRAAVIVSHIASCSLITVRSYIIGN